MRRQRTYQNDKPSKLVLHCEECSVECVELHFVKGGFMFCKECKDAQKRRDRFKREEAEWNATEKSLTNLVLNYKLSLDLKPKGECTMKNLKVILTMLLTLTVLTACGPGFQTDNTGPQGAPGAPGTPGDPGAPGATGPQGPAGPAATAPTPTAVQQVIANENAYRESLGQTALTLGLSCSVQAIASGQYLSSASPGYTAAQAIVLSGPSYPYLLTAGFNQPNSNSGPNNVLDPALQPLFLSNNYRIVCSGQLVVPANTDDYHSFSMSSDDGSILTIDGTTVISNDGSHGISTVSGVKALDPNIVHSFTLQYAQSGAGQFALILNMDGAVLPAANLYH